MTKDIKCPNCGHAFDVENVLAADIEKKLQLEYGQKLQQSVSGLEEDKKKLEAEQLLFEEKKKNQNEIFAQRILQEKVKMESELQEQLRKSISSDYENRMKMLQQECSDTDAKLKESRKKELDFMQKEKEFKNKEEELELTLQKRLQEERQILT